MPTEIFAADLLVQEPKSAPKWIRKISYKETSDAIFDNKRYVKEPAKILQVIKHKSLGFSCD